MTDAAHSRHGSATLLDAVTTVRRTPVLPVARARMTPATRWLIGLAGVVVLCTATVLAAWAVRDPSRFPVSNVDVNGTLDYTDRDALQRLVQRFTEDGFYAVDIETLRHEIERFSWVAEARIAREWPGRLDVAIEEHEPAARWNDDALLSKRLVLFRPPQLQPDDARHAEWQRVFARLPGLSGAEGRHAEVLDDFRRHAASAAGAGLQLVRLDEDDRRSQTAQFGRDITARLGYEERDLRMSRFLDVQAQLADEFGDAPVVFDMRYSDGFAVAGGARR